MPVPPSQSPRPRPYLVQPPSDAEVESAIIYAKISRGLKMEKPIDALLALADSASVGADPAACVSALDSVTVQGVKAAASAAFQSGMSMAAVGNISEVRACVRACVQRARHFLVCVFFFFFLRLFCVCCAFVLRIFRIFFRVFVMVFCFHWSVCESLF